MILELQLKKENMNMRKENYSLKNMSKSTLCKFPMFVYLSTVAQS